LRRDDPKNVDDDQIPRRTELSAEMPERLEAEQDFHNRAITGDERFLSSSPFFLGLGPEAKRQNDEW
jgi:hypothetical protein